MPSGARTPHGTPARHIADDLAVNTQRDSHRLSGTHNWGRSPELQLKLENILYQSGIPTQLPADVLELLSKRREQAQQLGPWVEGHHRPGIVFERRKRKN